MSIPDHLIRYPTRAAIHRLSKLFNLPNEPGMQDWEIQVADASRCAEFVSGYESLGLDDDERFTLMWTILQSFEEFDGSLGESVEWQRALFLLEADIEIHISTLWYWSSLQAESNEEMFRITPHMREILSRQSPRLEIRQTH
ncbi:MAG: hypothetical protein K0U72_02950 [Gammaproteobacteria bacterium]|nr:hypothetical protein [Gammaproteobacteria bacterium]